MVGAVSVCIYTKAPPDDVLERKIVPNYFIYDHDDAAEHIHISLVFIEGGHYCPVFSLIDSRLKKPNALLQQFVLADIDFVYEVYEVAEVQMKGGEQSERSAPASPSQQVYNEQQTTMETGTRTTPPWKGRERERDWERDRER
jgi:hypothetical protein